MEIVYKKEIFFILGWSETTKTIIKVLWRLIIKFKSDLGNIYLTKTTET